MGNELNNIKLRLEDEIRERQEKLTKEVDAGLSLDSKDFTNKAEFIRGLVYAHTMMQSETLRSQIVKNMQDR